jgi:hypothetical protein
MIPTPSKVPQFSVLSPDSITFNFNDLEESEEFGPHIDGVRVKGRKIYSSFEPDMHNSIIEVDLLPITDLEISLQGLTRGKIGLFLCTLNPFFLKKCSC